MSQPAIAIVRQPGDDLELCELSFLERESVDARKLTVEHGEYVRALKQAGLEVVVLPTLLGFPDGLYVEDAAVVLDELAILTRPGAESRRGEVASIAAVLKKHRPCSSIEAPATLDGGDVCLHEGVLYVGQGGRSNHAGIKQLAHLVLEKGYMVKAVELNGCLHLKSALSSLPDGRLLVNRHWLGLSRLRDTTLFDADPREPSGANVLSLGDQVICSSAYPYTNDRLRAAGFNLIEVDLREVHKMEAAVTCPSLILNAAPAASIDLHSTEDPT